jgi:hypothetical protein
MGDSKKTQRKFILACAFALVGSAGMFIPPYPITGDKYLALVGLVLAIYGGANVLESLGWPSKKALEKGNCSQN